MTKTCLDCGNDYDYDPMNPLGSSSDRCCRCRKLDSAKNKKIILLEVACHGKPRCFKCGYSRSVGALKLVDAFVPLDKPKNLEEQRTAAARQYVLCANCDAEIHEGVIESKVVNSTSSPIKVEFYAKEVRITRTKLEAIEERSDDAIEAEVTRDEPKTDRIVGTSQRVERIEAGNVLDV